MSLRFEHPEYLLLALAAIPLLMLGWRAMANTDRLRRITALALRALLFAALAIMLAGPHMLRVHDHLTVIGLLDISGSVRRFADLPPISGSGTESERRSNIEFLRQWFRTATKTKAPDDRFGLVVFDGTAIAVCAPTRADYVDDNLDISISQGTNIADAVRLGLAMFPSDTAKRLVLVTDGNETAGSVMEAVNHDSRLTIDDLRLRSGADPNRQSSIVNRQSIPIDILPIAYNVTGDVQVVRVEAPPNAMPGQAVTVRIILEATAPTSGSLTLRREGDPVDLNGSQPGTSRHLNLPAGQSVQLAQVELGQTPINRFEAIFEADNPGDDVLPDNDRAEAFTATPSKGSVLVLNPRAGERSNALVQMLNSADLPAKALQPSQLPDDLLALQNYDLIVLDNVSAAELSAKQQQMLTKYVNDLGGGLIMVGGENSFGAGGWNGSIVESVLPVELDPSKELRLPTAALVLVLDKSGSMNQPVAGARKSQQQVANEGAALAIESLRSDSMVGVITFDLFAHVVVPLQTNEDPKKLSERVRSITADGGTNLEPGLQKAFEMLKDAKVSKKRVVCMSDGRSASRDGLADLAKEMNDAGIQVSAIAVGDDADEEMLRNIAKAGGGVFYSVRDPRRLPQVLIESVQVINNPLLKEGPFEPRVLPTGSTLTAGMDIAPPLGGLVITSAKPDPTIAMEMLHPDGEPLLAHWQAGLGRVAAFTSELPAVEGAWASKWSDWPTAATFWVQLARMIARPPMNQDAELNVTVQDDRVSISYERVPGSEFSVLNGPSDSASQNSNLDYLQVEGTVYKPDGTSTPVRLRQVAPGRFETSVDSALAGNYIVALNPRQGSKQLPPAIGGTNRATSPEFRRYKSNIGLLDEIAEETGGRRLSVTEPASANLFDRTGMPPSISSLPIWRSLLALALGLMLLDVACRRLAWDYGLLRGWAAKAIARVTPSHVRGREVAATLATLRRVSDDVESRQTAASASFSQSPNRRIATPADELAPSPDGAAQSPDRHGGVAKSPDRDDSARITAALDALMGRNASKPPAANQSPDDQPTKDAGEAAAETTGSLLAAKRRAQQRFNPSDPDK